MKISLLILMLFLVSCNPSGRRGRGIPEPKPQIDPVLKDLNYRIDLLPTSLGEDFQHNEFILPEDLKEGQKATISFLFSTDSNTQKAKFLSQGVSANCEEGARVMPQYTLIELSAEPKVVFSGVNVTQEYLLEQDKKYAYVISTGETTCKDLKFSVSMWLGPTTMSINYIKGCNYQSATVNGGLFHLTLNSLPTQASLYLNQQSALFGQNIICGQNISTDNVSYTQDLSTGSISGKVITTVEDQEVVYDYSINFEDNSGLIMCKKDGEEFFRATLSHCENRIVGVSSL